MLDLYPPAKHLQSSRHSDNKLRDAHLKSNTLEALRIDSSLLHGLSTDYASGERNEVDKGMLNSAHDKLRRQMEHLYNIRRHPCASECQCKAFRCEWGLWRWLEKNSVSCKDSRQDCIDRNEIGEARVRRRRDLAFSIDGFRDKFTMLTSRGQ